MNSKLSIKSWVKSGLTTSSQDIFDFDMGDIGYNKYQLNCNILTQ